MWSRSSAVLLVLLLLAACGTAPPVQHARPTPGHSQADDRLLVGVYEPYAPGSYWQIPAFAQATGRWPQLVSYYSPWQMPFATTFAAQVHAHGAETLVQIIPRGVSLADIAAGSWDGYLGRYASAVRHFGHPVIISFGQEMNGSWYPWGWTHTPARTFVAAWRHIVRLFRSDGARNVTWLWDVNHQYRHGMAPLAADWPGKRFVDWVGLDAYLSLPGRNYVNHVAGDVKHLRAFGKPILLAETAVGPRTGNVPAGIASIFAGVRQDHLLGLVWFDVHQSGSDTKQDWRLEGNAAALRAFREALAG